MRKNPERVAWTLLSLAFALFCAIAIGVPLGIRSYLLNAREDQDTLLQAIEGTVLVEKANGNQPFAVIKGKPTLVSPGDEVITDATSSATLDLFDRSHVILYSNSKVTLGEVQTPRFAPSKHPHQITLSLSGGLMRVGVPLPGERPTHFQVATPHTTLQLEEGSYRIEVTNQGTQVTVVRGQAIVGQDGEQISLYQGTRTAVDLTGRASQPLPAARNLIQNGSFQDPIHTEWVTDTPVLNSAADPPTVQIVDAGGRQAVRFIQRGADDGIHSEAIIQQKLDQDARDFTRLQVVLDVRLEFQSLSGGGMLSSEFPVIVRLDYKDLWGTDKFWTHGFYYHNSEGYIIAPDTWGQPTGEQIPRGVWYPYESGNLLELLGDNRPAYITGLTIYASGWNYESLVSEIQLIAE